MAKSSKMSGITVYAPAAFARIAMPSPQIDLGEMKRSVTWSKTPGGMWFGAVHDNAGNIIGVAVAENAEDVYLILADHLVPPQ